MKTDQGLEPENLEEEQPKIGKQQQDEMHHGRCLQRISIANSEDYNQYCQ
jgi:hypothetical protein